MKASLQWRILQLGIVFGVIIFLVYYIADFVFADVLRDLDSAFLANVSLYWELAANIVTGFLFVLGYSIFYSGIPGRGVAKGLQYGFWIWMVGSIPVVLLILSNFNLPVEIVVGWIILGLFISVVLGFLVGWLYRAGK